MRLRLTPESISVIETSALLNDIQFLPCYVDGESCFAIDIDGIREYNQFVVQLATANLADINELLASECFTLPIDSPLGRIAGVVWPAWNGHEFAVMASHRAISTAMVTSPVPLAPGQIRLHVVSTLTSDPESAFVDGEHELSYDFSDALINYQVTIEALQMQENIDVPSGTMVAEVTLSYLDVTPEQAKRLADETESIMAQWASEAALSIANMETQLVARLVIVTTSSISDDQPSTN